MSRITHVVRSLACGLLAIMLLACGRVRRAKRTALRQPLVTALYFHGPDAKLFLRCIRWLTKQGYTFISLAELMAFLEHRASPPPGAVWLSFDDGCCELLDNVLPVVRSYKIPVTLFIPSGMVGGDGRFPWVEQSRPGRHAITVEDLQEVSGYPEVTIGSHTVSHRNLSCCREEELDRELRDSRRTLEEWTGRTVRCISYPYGIFDERATRAARAAGYTLAVTTENAFVVPNTDPFRVPRFSIADSISSPEMICNIVGVWRPALDPLKKLLARIRTAPGLIYSRSNRGSSSEATWQ